MITGNFISIHRIVTNCLNTTVVFLLEMSDSGNNYKPITVPILSNLCCEISLNC